jgi:hypothetical protein
MRTINEYKNRFNQLLESQLGNVKPLIMEQETKVFDENYFINNPKGTLTTTDVYGTISKINGINLTEDQYYEQFGNFWGWGDGFGRDYTPGDSTYEYKNMETMRNPEGEMVINTISPSGNNAMYEKGSAPTFR